MPPANANTPPRVSFLLSGIWSHDEMNGKRWQIGNHGTVIRIVLSVSTSHVLLFANGTKVMDVPRDRIDEMCNGPGGSGLYPPNCLNLDRRHGLAIINPANYLQMRRDGMETETSSRTFREEALVSPAFGWTKEQRDILFPDKTFGRAVIDIANEGGRAPLLEVSFIAIYEHALSIEGISQIFNYTPLNSSGATVRWLPPTLVWPLGNQEAKIYSHFAYFAYFEMGVYGTVVLFASTASCQELYKIYLQRKVAMYTTSPQEEATSLKDPYALAAAATTAVNAALDSPFLLTFSTSTEAQDYRAWKTFQELKSTKSGMLVLILLVCAVEVISMSRDMMVISSGVEAAGQNELTLMVARGVTTACFNFWGLFLYALKLPAEHGNLSSLQRHYMVICFFLAYFALFGFPMLLYPLESFRQYGDVGLRADTLCTFI